LKTIEKLSKLRNFSNCDLRFILKLLNSSKKRKHV
jgi:hypothetical protein